MWNWDQGRLDYFQFGVLKKIAKFSMEHDLKSADRQSLSKAVGLPFFPNSTQYLPWRNYSRVFKLGLLVRLDGKYAIPTKLAKILSCDGIITTDEYFHFLSAATSDPSPALQAWDYKASFRYPLLFTLKFLLARASLGINTTKISEVFASYETSNFVGDETDESFIKLIGEKRDCAKVPRQAAESIKVIGQISYLSLEKNKITVSLSQEDASNMFAQLEPIQGEHCKNRDAEIDRITQLFEEFNADLNLDYSTTITSDTEQAGFLGNTTYSEGQKVRKTHLTIERNRKIRQAFFESKPTTTCNFCGVDTAKAYPWSERILDIHHLLPLCSGARTSKNGTILDDLVAICPTCHRGVHRYYDTWLKTQNQRDFVDDNEAKVAYQEAKRNFKAAKNVDA